MSSLGKANPGATIIDAAVDLNFSNVSFARKVNAVLLK
jgi:hypothetical protein